MIINKLALFSIFTVAVFGLGKTCSTNNAFVTSNFDVIPYPPLGGKLYNVTMTGVFTKNITLSQINTQTSYNGGGAVDVNFVLGQNYISNRVYNFYFSLTAGSLSGLYGVKVHLDDKSGYAISCWEYSYHI